MRYSRYCLSETTSNIRKIHFNAGEMSFNAGENTLVQEKYILTGERFSLTHDRVFTAMCHMITIRKGIRKPGLEMNQAGSHFTN